MLELIKKDVNYIIRKDDYMKKGIDISYHQGDIDFNAVKKSGIEFVILREGYRNSTDTKFFEYVEKATKAGLEILGVYHFSYALNAQEAQDEAKLCVENIRKAGLDDDILVFFDFEYDTVKKAKEKGVTLTKGDCNRHTEIFCNTVRELGYMTGVYTNLDYYKNWYDKEVLNEYHVWLADYTGGPDYKCLLQQYSSTGSIPGIKGNVDLNYYYNEEFKMKENSVRSRNEVVKLATSWIGRNEADGSHKQIIDIYNAFFYGKQYPRGVKMNYTSAWCACTWSALAIVLGYTDIMPVELSCGELIKLAQKMDIWVENDGYIPMPGDAILYDWDDKGVGDNTGWPDHIGVIDYVNEESGYMTVIEGNYQDAVKKRTVSINGKFIRGFIVPDYTDDSVVNESVAIGKDILTVAREVISGLWGNNQDRKNSLTASGYDYNEVQSKVNEILNNTSSTQSMRETRATCNPKDKDNKLSGTWYTTGKVYCRNDAGTNKAALCIIPKDFPVETDGSYTDFNGTKWLLVKFVLNGTRYCGFVSSKYLRR